MFFKWLRNFSHSSEKFGLNSVRALLGHCCHTGKAHLAELLQVSPGKRVSIRSSNFDAIGSHEKSSAARSSIDRHEPVGNTPSSTAALPRRRQ